MAELTPAPPEQGGQPAPSLKRKPPRKREWQPPRPECQYLRLPDFFPLYELPRSTTYRLAMAGELPYIRVPGTKILLFPRARVEQIIRSWERNGRGRGRRSAPERETPEAQPGKRTPPAVEGKSEVKTTTIESTTQPD